ncbi:hypothetical protein A9P82_01720 [Arachidicoccus ginsenosidimutans]|uniref:DUF4374 domain-containing protein n=1 Tax=Arachidicoccus sp. BS20 TaxID=1850526 RepID=UPI0007F17DB6|nr:DUF4374 domain-containing protein [Arachidicoccus sp. BS20]ANI88140.1 hypothetical protein A9P82_01720 [Arachidicoccus sp. BS20]
MTKSKFVILVSSALLLLSACSKKDVSGNQSGGNGGGDSTVIEQPKDSIFVLTTASSPSGAEVINTAETLDSGVLNTQGTGIEQDGATHNYIVNGDYFISFLFGQSNPGAVTAYKADASKQLVTATDFQTESMTMFGNAGDEVLMVKNAWQPEEQYTQWYRLDTKSMEIVAQGQIDAEALAANGQKAFFTDIKKVGDKIFASFISVESGLNFETQYPDSNWIAVYNYPDMTLDKVIRDGRTGSIGTYWVRGMDVDENGDTYVFGTKLDWDMSGKYSTATPVGIMKIKSGTTEYDPTFFFNITSASGGEYVWRKDYLGKGYFLLTMVPQPYVYAVQLYLYPMLMGGIKYAVVNVYDGSFKWVTGTPEATDIQFTSGSYSYSALDGTGYAAIYYTDAGKAKSTVFKFDAATATATPGLTTDGNAIITGISRLPVAAE